MTSSYLRAGTRVRLRAPSFIAALAALLTGCGSDPQVPSAAAATAATTVSGAVASAVSAVPAIRITDAKGKGVKNVLVRWRVTSGGGDVTNDSVRTSSSGEASSGGWTLGTGAGQQTLQATADGIAPVTFTASAAAAAVARLTPVSATSQSVGVTAAIAELPAVRAEDQYGNPVSGVAVAFALVQGTGTLGGTQSLTDVDGIARLGLWIVGAVAGPQSVIATAAGIDAATFTVLAVAGPATDLVKLVGDNQVGIANQNVSTPPGVRVVDAFGNPVGNIPVTFTPGVNSGTITGGTVVSDPASGTAFVGSWRLGTSATQTLVATSSALPGKSVTFTTSVTSSLYSIDVRFVGNASLAVRTAFANAVARWQQVIVGSIGTVDVNIPAGPAVDACSDWSPAIAGTVQNTVIFARIDSIDGAGSPDTGNILGQASPCYVNSSSLPFLGFMEFDSYDVDLLVARGQFEKVVLHEIGHVLGIGTIWNFRRSLLNTTTAGDPFYVGASGRAEFAALNTLTYSGNPVPVENTGGVGTTNSHWRTSVMLRELMQGFAVNQVQPLSRITVGSLQDLGYTVNLAAADAFSLTAALRSGFGFDVETGVPFRDIIPDVIIRQRRADGTIVPLVRMP